MRGHDVIHKRAERIPIMNNFNSSHFFGFCLSHFHHLLAAFTCRSNGAAPLRRNENNRKIVKRKKCLLEMRVKMRKYGRRRINFLYHFIVSEKCHTSGIWATTSLLPSLVHRFIIFSIRLLFLTPKDTSAHFFA
jgi:hypothetical protein